MQPGWPIVMAPDVPGSVTLSSSAQFSWAFPASVQAKCTVNGVANVSPCVGRVIDITLHDVGTYAVTLTITDGSNTKIIANKNITVYPAD